MAHHDSMTSLMNRAGLEDAMTKLTTPYICAIIDINRLKPVNDTFGHEAGDAMLTEIAFRLRQAIPETAIAGRMGGDEFVVIAPHVHTDEQLLELGDTLVSVFEKPVNYNAISLSVGAAIGLANSRHIGAHYQSVAAAADAAMYKVKKFGKTDYQIYSKDMASKIFNLERKAEISKSLEASEFKPSFQAKVDFYSQEIIGFEALCRWHHKEEGILLPGNFLDELYCYDLQHELTDEMLRSVLQDLRDWEKRGYQLLPVSINISADMLASRVGMDKIEYRLNQFSDVKNQIMFEITEDVFLDGTVEAIKLSIQRLKKHNIRISIDDFGSGYASFRHLKEISFHELKIDSSFVEGIGKDKSAEVILKSFITLAQGLGVKVVAEGVETELQCEFLKDLGYDYAQGFLFAKPISSNQARQLLSMHSSWETAV